MEFTEVIRRRKMVRAFTGESAIAIGYPDPGADPVPPARAGDRKSLDELVHQGRW